MTAKKRRSPVHPGTGANHETGKNTEHAAELIIGLGGILLATFVGFDQVQSHRGTLASARSH